ncbi:WD repeat-containing protein 43 [Aricia agestis]|uniref:WD repeat-containing protein 43 n=1 Tax=Aricia agestis TaxID=91739 RepID=UPI001C2068FD|nr:WD repeat-containing protein 43 [Aricia agestis]
MAEAAFSDDGKYYSAISQDGRLRIWDTETNVLKQEYTPDNHLTSPPSCLQWINVSTSNSPRKGRRKSISEQESSCIALGTTNGVILVYSIAQAKVESVLTGQKNSNVHKKVQCLDWHRKYGLISCTSSYVVEWDLSTANVKNTHNVNINSKKQGDSVSAIKIVPHNHNTTSRFVITASSQIRLWRLDDAEATVVKCFGHNASPKALLTLATINKSCWLIEGSQNERLLSFWDVTITDDALPQQNGEEETPSKRQRKKSISAPTVPTPTYNFVLEDAPRIIDAELQTEDSTTRLRLAACTRSGVIHYYGHNINGATTKPIKPSVTIHVTTADATPLQLSCCRLPPAGDLVIGYSSGPSVLFEKVVPDLKTKTQVLIRGQGKAKKKQNIEAKSKEKTSNTVTYVEPMGGVNRKRATPGGNVEVSMESRLANLSIDIKSRSKSAVSQNLTKLLVQGLHSKDKNIILTVLQHDDPLVASRTVSALPADYVPILLEQLADMATRKTSQCAAVCTWARALTRAHAALLLASGARAGQPLAKLLTILTHRRSHLCQLLNLKGRIELTLSQKTNTETDVEHQPVLQYNDSSSDEEMEIERYQSESEQSWGDDHDVDDVDGDVNDGNDVDDVNDGNDSDDDSEHSEMSD